MPSNDTPRVDGAQGTIVDKRPIVLVHGAWSDARVFDRIVPQLEAKGHQTVAVYLPGHGEDDTPFERIGLRSYIDAVVAAVGDRRNILLVGNSMAGLVISAVAERIPEQVGRLLYVGAFIPKDGDTTFALASTDAESRFGEFLTMDEAAGTGTFTAEGYREVFAEFAPGDDLRAIVARARAEPLSPLKEPVALTEARFGTADIAYVHTTQDRALGYELQREMVARAKVQRVYALPSDHWPFLSFPGVVAEILAQEAAYTGREDATV